MKPIAIPNDLVEWLVIIAGVTAAGLLGAGAKSWMDNVLSDSGASGWLPGVCGIAVFVIVAAPVYAWAAWSARARENTESDDHAKSDSSA